MSAPRNAVSEAFRVDLHQVAPWAGLLRAIPVTALVLVGLAIGSPRVALTLGIGANLVAIVSLVGAVRVHIGLLVADAVGLGVATFIGSATASDFPLHICVLALWSFCAGLIVVVGLGPATAGVQSVIAFVVFGRFVDSPLAALELGGLVLLGAMVEVSVLLLLRLPPTLRAQRSAIADGYEDLALLASEDSTSRAVRVAEDFDAASELLGSRPLFGRSDVQALQGLIDEGRRLRLEVLALSGLRHRVDQDLARAREPVDGAMRAASQEIEGIARSLSRSPRSPRLKGNDNGGALSLEAVRALLADVDQPTAALLTQALAHLEALGGQIRAAQKLLDPGLAAASSPQDGPRPRSRISLRAQLGSELALIHSSLTLQSSTFRHAVRLAVAVPAAELLGRALSLPRSYWVAFAVVAVLKPDYGSLFRNGLGRVVGTILGGTIGALVVGGLHPNSVGDVVLVAITAWGSYSIWQASFSIAMAFGTALVLVLLSTTQADSLSTATDRLIDTVVGGALALLVYVLWPTWSRGDAYAALAALARAERTYLAMILKSLQGPHDDDALMSAARTTRLAWSKAESTVGRSLQEPRGHQINAEVGNRTLAATRRLIHATQSLRAEIQRGLVLTPEPELDALAAAFSDKLDAFADRLDGSPSPAPTTTLRTLFEPLSRELEERAAPPVVTLQLDEIVDAINTLDAISLPAAAH